MPNAKTKRQSSCPVPTTRDGFGDHCSQVTKERGQRWIRPGCKTHGQQSSVVRNRGYQWLLKNGHRSKKNLQTKRF